jgi:hypothetical protein
VEDTKKNLRHILDLARAEIIRGNSSRALEYLRGARSDAEEVKGSTDWAEYQLLLADALAEAGDPTAQAEFEEAVQRACNLRDRDTVLEMRVYDDFGKFLVSFDEHQRSLAREYTQTAYELAVRRGQAEDSARLKLRIVMIDLKFNQNHAGIEAFRNLKKAAKDLGASYQRQLAAWVQYCGETQGIPGMLAARGRRAASVDYFRGLLTSTQ